METFRQEWTSTIDVKQSESLFAKAEAFFCSYGQGEYVVESREKYRMVFRRGKWIRAKDGTLQPAPSSEIALQGFEVFPMVLRVLLQPNVNGAIITLKHEVLTRDVIHKKSKSALSEIVKREWAAFQDYCRENQNQANAVEIAAGTQTEELPAPVALDGSAEQEQVPFGLPLPMSRTVRSQQSQKKLNAWWPNSSTGITLLCLWLVLTFFAPLFSFRASILDGFMGAGINYLIVIAIRYFAVVLPSRK